MALSNLLISHRVFCFSILFAGVLLSQPNGRVLGQEDSTPTPIAYSVNLSDAKNHYLTITATFQPPEAADETEIMMAVWTPGSYLVREYARHIDTMTVTDAEGNALPFQKTRKNRWLVQNGDSSTVVVQYRLYANEMSVRTNWVGMEYAMINGAPTFITLVDGLDLPHVVQLELPRNWKRSATSLHRSGGAHRYVAESFDELVDSPIVAGNISVYPFDAGGVKHQLVNIGESGYWDGSKAASDLQPLVEAHQEMWGTVPYDRYLFLNMISESGGGLEHDNSTLIMTSRWSFRSQSRYQSWLSLASHEFFHTWNVRRLRPRSLVEYDYENEVYTKSLWVAEGITSYYQDLLLVRAGLMDRNAYLRRLSREVESVQRTIGRTKQSLADSSYDAWIKYYRQDENSRFTQISYYTKGAVAAFLLDVKIRKLTDGQQSLDDVMRTMFEKYSETGYTPEEFRTVASEIAGEDLTPWFRNAIDSTEELDFSDLEFIGIQVPEAAQQQMDEEDDAADDSDDRGSAWIGLSAGGDSRVTVSSVQPDSPAYEAGIVNGDELIAVNGYRLSGSINSRLDQYEVGDEIELLIARRGELKTVAVTIESNDSENWRLRFVSKPDASQKSQQASWLSGDQPEPVSEEEENGDEDDQDEDEQANDDGEEEGGGEDGDAD